jgi:cell division transport system permease protein
MFFYRIGYFIREALKNIRHSPLLTTISILTIAVSLILVGFFGGLLLAADSLVDKIAEDILVSAYLEPDISQEDVDALSTAIQEREGVESVRYVSRDEDLARNRKALAPELLAGLDEDSIPASPTLEVVLEKDRRLRRDVEELNTWVKQLQGVDGVSEVELGMDKIRLGLAFVEVFNSLAWAICIVLVIAAVFFVFSTIRMAVHGRYDEIEILRLVGATNRFIRVPFYLEGIFQGLMGSLVAFSTVLYLHERLNSYIRQEHLLDWDLNLIPWELIVWFFAGGILLGLLGSVFSVGRYLRG